MTAEPAITLSTFDSDMTVAVIGASGGIGHALAERLSASERVARVFACSRSGRAPRHAKIVQRPLDLEDEASIAAVAASLERPLDLAIVATGVLHDRALAPEKSWRALDGAALERAFRINAVGPALVAKHLLPLLARDRKAAFAALSARVGSIEDNRLGGWHAYRASKAALERAFRINAVGPALVAKHFLPLLARDRKAAFAALSARVGSIEDNRLGGWHAYRASKAALNMLIRTLAIELARRRPRALCVALHPGTVDTALSAPFQGGVPAGRRFPPRVAAAHLLAVLDRLEAADSGRLFAWDGAPIAF